MPRRETLAILLISLALGGCKPAPAPDADGATGNASLAGAADLAPFRAHIAWDPELKLPDGARLVVYLLEADYGDASRQILAESSQAVARESSVAIQFDVPRAELNAEMGYAFYAAIVGANNRPLLTTITSAAPTPGTALYQEAVHLVRLVPVATPAPPEQVFRLPRAMVFACDELEVRIRQDEVNDLLLALPEATLRLAPAVATAGGRFSDGLDEFWITDELQAFLMVAGQAPRACERQ